MLELGRYFNKFSPEERHQPQIDRKKLRHTAEFFRSLYRKKRQIAYFHALSQLQDSLGRMNYIAVADQLLRPAKIGKWLTIYKPRSASSQVGTAHSAIISENESEANWRAFCGLRNFLAAFQNLIRARNNGFIFVRQSLIRSAAEMIARLQLQLHSNRIPKVDAKPGRRAV